MKDNAKRKKGEKLVKKPNGLLYFAAGIFFKIANRAKYGLRKKGAKPKGPAIILSNHTSNQDWKLIADAVWPRRITFVATYHWFTFKKLGFWLKAMGAIPKKQFAVDMGAMKKMRYVLEKNKGIVYIAPEGTVYGAGTLGPISPSIAKTIKIFRVPVYAARIEGAGLGNAKWALSPHKGKTEIETSLIVTKEETESLGVDEIMERIISSLSYSEFDFQKRQGVVVKGDDKMLGFDTMFYKCPRCREEFTLKASGNEVECLSCGIKATLGDDFRFSWNAETQYFDNYSEWYEWQLDEMKKEVADPSFLMEEEVDYGIDESGKDNYTKVGRGVIKLTREGWEYRGTKCGEETVERDAPEDVYLATLKIGKHFELPFKDGHCRVFYPVADGRRSMKWHLASRAMTELLLERKGTAAPDGARL